MGLDMYLYLRKYESSCRWNNKTSALEFYPAELGELGEEIFIRNFMSKETDYQVGYWRKANAIHRWIVDNCANGEDDCKPVHLSEGEACELLEICKKVYADHSLEEKLLPIGEGLFFGSLDYDDWYYEDIEYTIDLLQKVLALLRSEAGKKYDIIYQASW